MGTSLHVAFLITEPLWLMTVHRYRLRALPKPYVTHGYSHTGLQILYISIQIDLYCVRAQVVIWTTHLSSYIHTFTCWVHIRSTAQCDRNHVFTDTKICASFKSFSVYEIQNSRARTNKLWCIRHRLAAKVYCVVRKVSMCMHLQYLGNWVFKSQSHAWS